MSEYKRRLYDIVSDRTGLIIMQIASADSHIFQLYKHLIVLWLRDVTLLKSILPIPSITATFIFPFIVFLLKYLIKLFYYVFILFLFPGDVNENLTDLTTIQHFSQILSFVFG